MKTRQSKHISSLLPDIRNAKKILEKAYPVERNQPRDFDNLLNQIK